MSVDRDGLYCSKAVVADVEDGRRMQREGDRQERVDVSKNRDVAGGLRKCVPVDKTWVPVDKNRLARFMDGVSLSRDDVPMFLSVVPSPQKENFLVQR
jgi:hypothetical protein